MKSTIPTYEIMIREQGRERTARVRSGESLFRALVNNGFDIASLCGGEMSCGLCHIILHPEAYEASSPQSEREIALLEVSRHYRQGMSRLACQVVVKAAGALTEHVVEIAPDE